MRRLSDAKSGLSTGRLRRRGGAVLSGKPRSAGIILAVICAVPKKSKSEAAVIIGTYLS